MKAELTVDGVLAVTPETDLEASALGLWSKVNPELPAGLTVATNLPEKQLPLDGLQTGEQASTAGPAPWLLGGGSRQVQP